MLSKANKQRESHDSSLGLREELDLRKFGIICITLLQARIDALWLSSRDLNSSEVIWDVKNSSFSCQNIRCTL